MLRKPMATPFDREILKKLKDYSVLTRSGRTIRSLSDDSSIAGGNTERIYCKSRYMEINFFREINFTEIVKLISRKKIDILVYIKLQFQNHCIKTFFIIYFHSHQDFSTLLNQKQLLGEMTYIIQPLVYLTSLGYFGTKSWIPWVLSGCCDIFR